MGEALQVLSSPGLPQELNSAAFQRDVLRIQIKKRNTSWDLRSVSLNWPYIIWRFELNSSSKVFQLQAGTFLDRKNSEFRVLITQRDFGEGGEFM